MPKELPVSLEVLSFGEDYGNNNKFTGGIPSEWGALTNLKDLKMVACGLDGKALSTRTERFMFSMFVDKLRRAPGRVPKELASLTELTELKLLGNKNLKVPDGAPTDHNCGMGYESRERVAAFQACLK